MFFVFGVFVFVQAHGSSNAGSVKTGSEHPHRETISHSYSPVPGSSNVDEDANRQVQGEKSASEECTGKKSASEEGTGKKSHASHLSEGSPGVGNSDNGVNESHREG